MSNSILIVEFAHQLRMEGKGAGEAVVDSCRVRLRPILMTSLATIIGLMPMAMKLGEGSESYAPLARALIGGLLVSVMFTAFLVPAGFIVYTGTSWREGVVKQGVVKQPRGISRCDMLPESNPRRLTAMKKMFMGLVFSALIGLPLLAALKVSDKAPDFSAQASLAGKEFRFSLQDALKKGPVVVYFYPSAYTKGCDLEAHTFAQEKEKFDAAGATIIGVSADSIARLDEFSADPDYCAGKFPVASDPDRKIATSYDLTAASAKAGMKDVRGADINHDFIERVTFVIGQDHKVIATFSSAADKVSPDQHVQKALEIVQKLASK
jgi:peroxiredoxin